MTPPTCAPSTTTRATGARRPKRGSGPGNGAACVECGAPFAPRAHNQVYCSRPCCRRSTNRSRRRRLRDERSFTCIVCSQTFGTVKEGGAKYCSKECEGAAKRTRYYRGGGANKGPRTRIRYWVCDNCDRIHVLRPGDQPHCQRCPRADNLRRVWIMGTCRRCGAPFTTRDNRGSACFCSGACARNDAKARRRARLAGAETAPYSRIGVFTRDGWECHLCGGPLDSDLAGTSHRLAPTIDHVIPLALGGADTPENVRAAHRFCNSLKGARVAA